MSPLSETLTLAGALAVLLAAIAWAGDRRRMRRKDLDRVGFVPWTTVFFVSLIVACVLLGLAAREGFGG